MARIDSILTTPLFQNARVRKILSDFIKLKFNIADEYILNDTPYSRFFNTQGNLIEEVNLAIRNAAHYLGFEHDTTDKTLENLIFLSLIFSLREYPDIIEWELFLNNPLEIKRSIIISGVSNIWVNYQKQLVEDNLNNDRDQENQWHLINDPDELPF